MLRCLALAKRDLGDAMTNFHSRFPQTATLLDQSQVSGASYRNATCYLVADPSAYALGSKAILAAMSCKRLETQRQTATLRATFTD